LSIRASPAGHHRYDRTHFRALLAYRTTRSLSAGTAHDSEVSPHRWVREERGEYASAEYDLRLIAVPPQAGRHAHTGQRWHWRGRGPNLGSRNGLGC
jgi:hypothetical protein